MKTVHEVSRCSGVSVRTLHHYDAIGLLKPTAVTAAGYRLYDDAALARLQTILLFRELQFPLRAIKEILENPDFDREEALRQQIGLLQLRRSRLDNLISFARALLKTGGDSMDFSAFDQSKIEQYSEEVKNRWGKTDAYRQYEEKAASRSADAHRAAAEQLMDVFAQMGKIRHLAPDSAEAQAQVEALCRCITENYYTCTPQILQSLGEMYTGDERFRVSIDARGGAGTAAFAGSAIAVYCERIEASSAASTLPDNSEE